MEYPAKFTREGNGYVITFPDVPGATQGETIEEAEANAAEVLELALAEFSENNQDLPAPSRLKRGMRMVRVPALTEAKLRLYEEVRAAGLRKSELARRLRIAPSHVDRLLDINHKSKLDQIEAAFKAIGKRLTIDIVDETAAAA